MIQLVCYSEDRKLQPLLSSVLGPEYQIVVECDKAKVKALVLNSDPDVLLLDLDSNYGTPEDALAIFNLVSNSLAPVVVMADDNRRLAAIDLLRRGAYDYFRKPPALTELRVVLARAYERVTLKRELERTRERLRESYTCDRLVGSSAPVQAVYSLIRRVADLNAPVLIRGESGTGKELIARAIHNLSKRARTPFVAVASGAIPETLVESELFGHEKGAFTGTTGSREGYFEQAGEGTLFLDEIGELSLQTQVKLLRVLQQREFSRLGSNKLIPLQARVLFATHRPLEKMMEDGTFRTDLFFRLNVVSIVAPPLRDRAEDIPILAQHFLQQYSAAFQKPMSGINPEAMQILMEYSWPGNIRELENAVQAAVIMASSEFITPEDLPRSVSPAGPRLVDRQRTAVSFEDQLREYKAELANEALAKCNGNKTLAARHLRISRAYLHRLIRAATDTTDVA